MPALGHVLVTCRAARAARLSDTGAEESAARLVSEVARVLREGGSFLLLSIAPPERRLPLLEVADYGWKVTAHAITKPSTASAAASVAIAQQGSGSSSHYLYVCTKEER